jgi:hypothetical protein
MGDEILVGPKVRFGAQVAAWVNYWQFLGGHNMQF